MKIKVNIFLLLVFCLQLSAQEKRVCDFRVGAGISLLGSGDMLGFNYENELNMMLNRYFTTAVSFCMGRSNYGVSETASFSQGNINFFLSPFKNTRDMDFRVGTGLTYYRVSDAWESAIYWENGYLTDIDYEFDQRTSVGFNIIIEGSLLITRRLMAGLKVYTQPYMNGDINSGVMVKTGYRLFD